MEKASLLRQIPEGFVEEVAFFSWIRDLDMERQKLGNRGPGR